MEREMDTPMAIEALDHSPAGVMITGADGLVIWTNISLAELAQIDRDNACGKTEASVLAAHLSAIPGSPNLFKVTSAPAWEDRWLLSVTYPMSTGSTVRYFVDVSETVRLREQRDELTAQLEGKNTADGLTGLLNARALMQALEPQVSRSRRYGNPLSVIVMEVAAFKPSAGENTPSVEQVLTSVSHYLRDQMRWVDLIGRTGDNQFTLILPETSKVDAEKLAEKILQRMDSLTLPNGDAQIKVNASLGVAGWQKGDDLNKFLSRAHEALTQVKQGTLV